MAKVFKHDNTSTHLDYMTSLDIDVEAQFVRLSGIICTIGKFYPYSYFHISYVHNISYTFILVCFFYTIL